MKKIEIGKAIGLSRSLDYQKGTIVSKELLRKKTGTLTLFAFDKGEELSEHTAPFDATILVLDGTASVYIEGRLHKVKKGELIVMPANRPHAVKAMSRFKMMLIMIRSE